MKILPLTDCYNEILLEKMAFKILRLIEWIQESFPKKLVFR